MLGVQDERTGMRRASLVSEIYSEGGGISGGILGAAAGGQQQQQPPPPPPTAPPMSGNGAGHGQQGGGGAGGGEGPPKKPVVKAPTVFPGMRQTVPKGKFQGLIGFSKTELPSISLINNYHICRRERTIKYGVWGLSLKSFYS